MLSTSQPAAVIVLRAVHTYADVTASFARALPTGRASVRSVRAHQVWARPASVVLAASLLLSGCAAADGDRGDLADVGQKGTSATGAAPQAPPDPPDPVTSPGSSPEPSPVAGPTEAPGDAPPQDGVAPATVPRAAPSIDLTAHSATDPASPWVVVNKRAPLDPIDHEPELTTVRGYLVRPDAAPDVAALLDAADADGVHLTLRSAYRGYPKQVAVYDGWAAQLGVERADAVSARPGHSEHQTGLAVDVGSSTQPGCDFKACFGETVEGRWVAEHAAEFGLVVRYTSENSAITGYEPEPWHLRWVGRDLAAYMSATGVTTLEELFDVPGGDYAR
jgi:D-alanyl-D-alanine carboxypeptidase